MKSLIMLFGIAIYTMVCVAAPQRSILGANGTEYAGSGEPWVNPYITDGLIAMWDGEWNAGQGKHDENATVWKDLVRLSSISLSGNYSIYDKYIQFNLGRRTVYDVASLPQIETCEICATIDGPSRNYNCGISISQNGRVAVFGRRKNESVWTWVHTKISMNDDYGTLLSCSGILNNQTGFYLYGQWKSGGNSGWRDYWYTNKLAFWTDNTWASQSKVYSIRFYNRALTAEEIQHNYLVDKERFNLP